MLRQLYHWKSAIYWYGYDHGKGVLSVDSDCHGKDIRY